MDKLQYTDYETEPANTVAPPAIKQCRQHIECRLNKVVKVDKIQSFVLGDILDIVVDEDLASFFTTIQQRRRDMKTKILCMCVVLLASVSLIAMPAFADKPDKTDKEQIKMERKADKQARKEAGEAEKQARKDAKKARKDADKQARDEYKSSREQARDEYKATKGKKPDDLDD